MATTQQARYRIDGMDCAACATKIDTAVRRIPGVSDVSVSVTAGTMTVRHDRSGDLGRVESKVAGLGYSASPLAEKAAAPKLAAAKGDHAGHDHADHAGHDQKDHKDHDDEHATIEAEGLLGRDHGPTTGPWWQSKKGRLTIACGAALVAAYLIGRLVPAIGPYAFIAAMLVGLIPIARRAVMAARSGTPFSIEMLIRRIARRRGGWPGARQHPVADGAGAQDGAAGRERPAAGSSRRKRRGRRHHPGAAGRPDAGRWRYHCGRQVHR